MTPPAALLAVLEGSQQLGFLGPGPVEDHVAHALGFARSPAVRTPSCFLDLGSGGGVPGLVLALLSWPSASAVLLDAAARRCAFLEEAVASLSLGARVRVMRARAEEAGRDPALRSTFDVVVARSFAAPAVTAECSAPLLRPGGTLIVSEPPAAASAPTPVNGSPVPSSSDRWPSGPLAELGLTPTSTWTTPFAYQSLRQSSPCPDRFPRRVGIPSKRPLY